MTIDFKSNHFPDNFYRVSIKGLLVRDGKIMLLKETLAHAANGSYLAGDWTLARIFTWD